MLADTDAWQEWVLLLLQDSNEELTAVGTHDINGGQLHLQLRLIFLHLGEIFGAGGISINRWNYVLILRAGY